MVGALPFIVDVSELTLVARESFTALTAAGVAAIPPDAPDVLPVESLSLTCPYLVLVPVPYVVAVEEWSLGALEFVNPVLESFVAFL